MPTFVACEILRSIFSIGMQQLKEIA